jgi:hypothetical protein
VPGRRLPLVPGPAGQSGLELLQAGLNGRAIDFANSGLRATKASSSTCPPSRNVVLVRFGTEYNYDHWPELLAGLARRL